MNLSQKPRAWKYLLILTYCMIACWSTIVTAQLTTKIPEGALIIDVRTPQEYAESSNPASINIPLDQLESKLKTIDKNRPIVVCCRSGRRSALAKTILNNHGFNNVIDAGAWRNTLS